jgi:hypothetical protein
MITIEAAKGVIEGLRLIQYTEMDYNEFLKVLKRRLWIYTGRAEIMFFNEKKVVLELGRLGVLQDLNGLNKRAGSS